MIADPEQPTSKGRTRPLRILFALPGLHRVSRGAEIAFESIAGELAKRGDCEVTLVGSGESRAAQPYRFVHAGCRSREQFEHWPRVPVFRNHYVYEEATFVPGLWSAFNPNEFDATVTCSYPFVNWALRAKRQSGRPRHVFVTQNGDWPAYARQREYRYFGCDGLVCTNPRYFERNQKRWRSALIPNGVHAAKFRGVAPDRKRFGLPEGAPVAIIVSALIPSKRVPDGIRAAAKVPGLQLLVLGDGEQRDEVDGLGHELMPARYRRATVPYEEIARAYASADVLVHMSKDESFGNVYIEALAAGLPVVAHEWAGTSWILEDRAVLVNSDDLEAVAGGIGLALNDRSPRAEGARQQYAAERFAWNVVADQYASFIRSVVGEHG